MVIHHNSSHPNNDSGSLDMPRKFNEYQHSKRRAEECRQSNLSSNRDAKGQASESRAEYEAHQIGRKEMLQQSPFSSIDDHDSQYRDKFENDRVSIDEKHVMQERAQHEQLNTLLNDRFEVESIK